MEFSPDRSEWSMDFTLFYRLDNLFKRLDEATLSLDLYLWYNLILVLYKEIAPMIIEKERKAYTDKMTSFIPRFSEIKHSIDETGKFSIPADLYRDLQDFEISLRDVVNKKGIYLRVKDDVSYGIN